MEVIIHLPREKTNVLGDSKRTFLEKSEDFLWYYLISHLKSLTSVISAVDRKVRK